MQNSINLIIYYFGLNNGVWDSLGLLRVAEKVSVTTAPIGRWWWASVTLEATHSLSLSLSLSLSFSLLNCVTIFCGPNTTWREKRDVRERKKKEKKKKPSLMKYKK